MFHWLDWVAIGTYVAFALGVGTYMARRASRSTQDFYLAGRSLPWYVAGMNPLLQFLAPDIGPPLSSSITTKPGRFSLTVPNP